MKSHQDKKTLLANASLLTPLTKGESASIEPTHTYQTLFGGHKIAYFESVDIELSGTKILKISNHNDTHLSQENAFNCTGKLVIPGFVNTHMHMAMSLLKGISDDLSLSDWLHKTIFPIEGKFVSEDFVRTGVELSLAGTIASGITTYVDMYMYSGVSADVYEQQGVRAWVGQGIIDFAVPDNPTLSGRDYAQLESLVDRFGLQGRITPVIAPHAPYSVGNISFEKVLKVKTDLKVPMMIHMCEMKAEVEGSLRDYGKTPLQRLVDIGFTGPDILLAHAIHFSETEFELLVQHQFAVAHNPVSNMKLGSGVADIPRMLSSGVKVGLGSDGQASHNSYNFFEDLKITALLHKHNKGGGEFFSAADVFYMATLGGASALNMGGKIGSIEEGKAADLVMVKKDLPCFVPYDKKSWLSHLVYSGGLGVVSDVMVDGQWLFENFSHTRLDVQDVCARAQKFRARFESK